jgi:hypothetical protein
MQMGGEATEKLVQLKAELEAYNLLFEKTLTAILKTDERAFPIFALHQQTMALGVPIWEKEEKGGHWNIYLSSMREFIKKGLIRMDRIDEFQSLYQQKDKHYCLFVLSELGAQFIFLPRVFIEKE